MRSDDDSRIELATIHYSWDGYLQQDGTEGKSYAE